MSPSRDKARWAASRKAGDSGIEWPAGSSLFLVETPQQPPSLAPSPLPDLTWSPRRPGLHVPQHTHSPLPNRKAASRARTLPRLLHPSSLVPLRRALSLRSSNPSVYRRYLSVYTPLRDAPCCSHLTDLPHPSPPAITANATLVQGTEQPLEEGQCTYTCVCAARASAVCLSDGLYAPRCEIARHRGAREVIGLFAITVGSKFSRTGGKTYHDASCVACGKIALAAFAMFPHRKSRTPSSFRNAHA